MNELPLLFDEPLDRRSASIRASAAADSGRADAGAQPWPWWMAVARFISRFHPRLGPAAAADARALREFPPWVAQLALPLGVVAVCLVLSGIHAMTEFRAASQSIDWLRPRFVDVYTEMPLFMLGAIAVGIFSPALGAFLVVVFGVSDIAAAAFHPEELTPFPLALAGRLVAIWLLWLLAVEIPLVGRQLALSWRPVAGNRLVVAALLAVSTGAFIWIWTQAATVLIRPVFVWSVSRGVTIEAIQPVQVGGLVFAIAGALVAGGVGLTRGPRGLFDWGAAQSPQRREPRPLAIDALRRVVVAALLTVALGGLITAPFEAVVLFVALLGSAPLARFVADRTPIGTLVLAMPEIVRYVIAAGVAFGLAIVAVPLLYGPTVVDFFSVIVAVVIGMFVVQLVTTPGSAGQRQRSTLATTALVASVVAGTATLLAFAAPAQVYADNCSGLTDCWYTPFFAALAGASVPFLMAVGAWGAFSSPPPRPPDQKIWPYSSETPPEMPPGYDPPTITKPPPGTYAGDNKPISGRSLASSGAGTRT